MNTYIIYEGPSLLDGMPIVVLAQRSSSNRKTGDMVQTFILRSDIDPLEANRTGEDHSICGTCSLRGTPHGGNTGQARGRECYVTLIHAPLNKWKTYKRGRYEVAERIEDVGKNRAIRLGTYGDPMAVPREIWDQLLSKSLGWTGYTHQVNIAPDLCMTSVETLSQAKAAWARGERTYRIVGSEKGLKENEVLCPSERGVKCEDCLLCAGTSSRAKSVAIKPHGIMSGQLKRKLENTNDELPGTEDCSRVESA